MSIPKPLVQLNQIFIIVTAILGLFYHPLVLLIPFLSGCFTLFTKKNPVIVTGKLFLKKPLSDYVQEDRDQQLFNQWIATICLGIGLLGSLFSLQLITYLLTSMVILAAGLALTGFCVGCTIRFRYQQWKFKRTKLNKIWWWMFNNSTLRLLYFLKVELFLKSVNVMKTLFSIL